MQAAGALVQTGTIGVALVPNPGKVVRVVGSASGQHGTNEGGGAQSCNDAETSMRVLSALMVRLYPLKAATQRALPVAQVKQFNTSRNTIVLDNAHWHEQ